MIRPAAAAGTGPLSLQHDPLTSPLRTRPALLPGQGVVTPAARPAAAHLTNVLPWSGPKRGSLPLGSALIPAGGRQRGLGGGRGRDTSSKGLAGRRARGCPNGARPTATGACHGPAPFRASRPVGGLREPGLLATPKQGHVRTGLALTGCGPVGRGFRSHPREPLLSQTLSAAGRELRADDTRVPPCTAYPQGTVWRPQGTVWRPQGGGR